MDYKHERKVSEEIDEMLKKIHEEEQTQKPENKHKISREMEEIKN